VQADPRYETTTSVKSQIKFLEELDSLERKRHEEVQRGVLLRAAKVDTFPRFFFCAHFASHDNNNNMFV